MGGSKILSDKLNLQTGMLRVYNRWWVYNIVIFNICQLNDSDDMLNWSLIYSGWLKFIQAYEYIVYMEKFLFDNNSFGKLKGMNSKWGWWG